MYSARSSTDETLFGLNILAVRNMESFQEVITKVSGSLQKTFERIPGYCPRGKVTNEFSKSF